MTFDPEHEIKDEKDSVEPTNPRFTDADGEKEVVVRYPMDVGISVEVHPVTEE